MQLCLDSLPASHPCCHEILHMLIQVLIYMIFLTFLEVGHLPLHCCCAQKHLNSFGSGMFAVIALYI